MISKKIMAICLASSLLLVGCSSAPKEDTPAEGTGVETESSKDDVEEGFTGTKTIERLYDKTGAKGDVVVATVEFKDGTPINITLDVRQESGRMKIEQSEAGEYIMKEDEENALHEQIALLEDFIVANNFDLSAVNLTDEAGHTDAVSGVSIKVASYLEPIQELVTAIEKGEDYGTGFTGIKVVETPYAEGKSDLVVTTGVFEDGKALDVRLDVKQESGRMKVEQSKAGEYIMKEGEEHPIHEQLEMLEDFIVENNFDTSAVNLTDEDGHTDAVSGVSIKVSAYLEGVQALLNEVQ